MTEGVPLVIPEVNPDAMKGMKYGQGGIIANPNCSTIIALMAVTPLHKAAKVAVLMVLLLAVLCMTRTCGKLHSPVCVMCELWPPRTRVGSTWSPMLSLHDKTS